MPGARGRRGSRIPRHLASPQATAPPGSRAALAGWPTGARSLSDLRAHQTPPKLGASRVYSLRVRVENRRLRVDITCSINGRKAAKGESYEKSFRTSEIARRALCTRCRSDPVGRPGSACDGGRRDARERRQPAVAVLAEQAKRAGASRRRAQSVLARGGCA